MTGPHRLINPEELCPPRGFSHVVMPAKGRTVYFGGMDPATSEGTVAGVTLVEQIAQALKNLCTALEAAGARPHDLVSVQIFVTDAAEYRASLEALGSTWRQHLGRHYPAMALFEIQGLFHPDAKVEMMAIAVVPE